jgi:hypothetical protein
MSGVAGKHVKEITEVAKELPDSSLEVLLDFAQFLKGKKGTFSYKHVLDVYCSILTKKELFSKEGMRSSEKKKVKTTRRPEPRELQKTY